MKYNTFVSLLKDQVLILDGAMGTMVQNLFLPDSAYGGSEFSMLSDLLVFSRPKEVKEIHLKYFQSGANAVETNTFGASPLRLQEFDFSHLVLDDFPQQYDGAKLNQISLQEFTYRLNKQAAEIANHAKEEYTTDKAYDGRPLFVFGSIGPSNWVLSSTKADLKKGSYNQIFDNFYQQVCGLLDGGVDVLLFETQQDILELKVGILGATKAMEEKKKQLPIIAQVTVDDFSKMQIFNTDIHAAFTTIGHIGIDVFGINCSIGPDKMIPTVKKLSQYSHLPISIIPNAGLPISEKGKTVFKLSPKELATHLKEFVEQDGVNLVGGCCGTTPEHIQAISDTVKGIKPKLRNVDTSQYLSGLQNAVKIDSSSSLIRIGERLNVRGSKKVRNAVENESGLDQEALEEVIVEQTQDLGIDIIDVCMDSNLVNTAKTLVEVIQGQTIDFSGAMCLDSFDVEALEEAVKVYPGRPMINSISLEEYSKGVDKIDAVLEVTRDHSPFYICLATGPKGPAITADEKVELAKKIVHKVTTKYQIPHAQLLIDVNAFPIGSESIEEMNFAMESILAIPRIKALHPDLKISIGVGNLTNGLGNKPYMRKVLTSVFLDEARKVGMDAAIVNPNHYVPVESLAKKDYQIGLDIIQKKDMDAFERLEEIAIEKKGISVKKRSSYEDMELIPAVCEKIKDGYKDRTEGKLIFQNKSYSYKDKIVLQAAEIIKNIKPLNFINLHLMKAMGELGEGFAQGKVSLPHLLKSADVMKHVMGFLEKYMKQEMGQDVNEAIEYKATIVLGTVYQDVHSIGKDLVKTLLENYGYRVIDLGVQVPLEKFVETAKEYQAMAVGMSALLVQTSNHMITISKMLDEAGLSDIHILVGGAPVNYRHAAYVAMANTETTEEIRPNVFYCSSAMDGVNILNTLQDTIQKKQLIENNKIKLQKQYQRAIDVANNQKDLLNKLPRRNIVFSKDIPTIQTAIEVQKIKYTMKQFLPYLNEKSLYTLNWKYGGKATWEKKGIEKEELKQQLLSWVQKVDKEKWIEPQGIFAVLPCRAIDTNQVEVFDIHEPKKRLGIFTFNDVIGAEKKDIFSVAQYYIQEIDYIGIQLTTAGPDVDKAIQVMKEEDQADALLLQGLSDRVAEDMAEYIHQHIHQILKLQHKTTRYSPGYPSMKDLSNNLLISNILHAKQELKIEINEGYEFYPTGTTAAVICFHPEAKYQ